METLGHFQISLTFDTYIHVMPALQQEAATRMDEVLEGCSGSIRGHLGGQVAEQEVPSRAEVRP